MRIVSYVLMQLAPGTAKAAAETISKLEGIKMAHAVTGPFDIIAFAEVPDLSSLSDLVLAQIQKVDGVEKTQTAVVVSPDALEDVPRKRVYKSPTPPKDWVEDIVTDIVRLSPRLAEKPQEVLRRVRDEARKNRYRPVIAPAQVQSLLNRHKRASSRS